MDEVEEVPVAHEADNYGDHLLDQIFTLWIDAVLARDGLQRVDVTRAVVELVPGSAPIVRINEGAVLQGRVRTARPIEAGEPVTVHDITEIESLEPQGLDPDSGWIAFASIKGRPVIQFDFRYNRTETRRQLLLAADYLALARRGIADTPGPAIDNLYSAGELAVQAQMAAEASAPGPKSKHNARATWLDVDAQLGNQPQDASPALEALGLARPAARYAEAELEVSRDDLRHLADSIDRLIHAAAQRVGVLLDGHSSQSSSNQP